jgi:hypothetical protein
MLVRDADGKIHIISRKQCKNETVYNEKLFNIRNTFVSKYKNIFLNTPKEHLKNLPDYGKH